MYSEWEKKSTYGLWGLFLSEFGELEANDFSKVCHEAPYPSLPFPHMYCRCCVFVTQFGGMSILQFAQVSIDPVIYIVFQIIIFIVLYCNVHAVFVYKISMMMILLCCD